MNDEDIQCSKCGESYELRGGDEPSKYCDHCAHEMVESLERDNANLLKDLKALTQSEQRLQSEKCELERQLAFAKETIAANDHILEEIKSLKDELTQSRQGSASH